MKNCFQTGVIDVGAHAVRLELFDVRKNRTFQVLESMTRTSSLGADVFRGGFVTPETAGASCSIMKDYAEKLKEYGIEQYRAFATSAIREASNRDLVIDRVRQESGIELEILETAQEIQLVYLAMRDELCRLELFENKRILAVIVGSGSLFVLLTDHGKLCFCEEIPLGTERLYDLFGRTSVALEQLAGQLRSQDLPQRLGESAGLNPQDEVMLVTLGAVPRQLMRLHSGLKELEISTAATLMKRLRSSSVRELASEYRVSTEEAAGIASCSAILGCFLEDFRCTGFICLSCSTREAVLAQILRERNGEAEPFRSDLLNLCIAVGHKYGFDADHACTVSRCAMKIFEKLQCDFQFAPRSACLLEVAATLHDIGLFVNTRHHNEHSFYLISGTLLPGLSETEHLMTALIARFHREQIPPANDPVFALLSGSERVTVLKLAAILRVADALDCSRRGAFRNLTMQRRGLILELRSGGQECRPEKIALEEKNKLFSQVFGLKVRIEEAD